MDTLGAWRALFRNRFLVAPVIMAAVGVMVWIGVGRESTYVSSSSLLLMPPPPAPSRAQIDKNPSLANLNADNPYARSYDPTAVIGVVSLTVTSDKGRAAVKEAGGEGRFSVTTSTRYGTNSPFVDISAISTSPAKAERLNALVTAGFNDELSRIQAIEGASPRYFITSKVAKPVERAVPNTTETARLLVTVLGLAVLVVLALVSVGDALRESRGGSKTSPPVSLPQVPVHGPSTAEMAIERVR